MFCCIVQERLAVQDMLQKNRSLTQKVQIESESEPEAEESTEVLSEALKESHSNPWMQPSVLKKPKLSNPQIISAPVEKDTDAVISDSEEEEEEKDVIDNLFEEKHKTPEKGKDTVDDEVSDEELIIGLARKSTFEQLEQDDEIDSTPTHTPLAANTLESVQSPNKKPEELVDPNVLLSLKSKPVGKQTLELIAENEDNIDEQETERMTIAEAFEDDDVVAEFAEEKQKIIDEEKPKDIDLTLPGWGEWGGFGLAVSKRKKEK